jgi:nucleoside-diphosphate-sugar epimerase
VKSEDDPLDPTPVPAMRQSFEAMRYLDETVTSAGGAILRYGGFYGAHNDGLVEPVRKRQFPIVGRGDGVTSFIHLEDAASATVLALEQRATGIYHVVDDEPAPAPEWLPDLAEVLGAKPPRRVPRWLARLFAGEAVASELGWELRYPSWRQGFVATYAPTTNSDDGDVSLRSTTTRPPRAGAMVMLRGRNRSG